MRCILIIGIVFCFGCGQAPPPAPIAIQVVEQQQPERLEFGARRLLQRAEQVRRTAERARRAGDTTAFAQSLEQHLELSTRALEQASREEPAPSRCYFLSELASGEQLRGNHDKAEGYRRDAFSLAQGAIQKRDMRERLFRHYEETREWDKARDFLNQVRDAEENELERLLIQVHMAEVELEAGNTELARQHGEQILSQGQRMAHRARTLRAMKTAYRVRERAARLEGLESEAEFCNIEAEDLEKQARAAGQIGMH